MRTSEFIRTFGFASLRLTALNEEIGLQEHGTGEGDTYTDVMKDFSQRLQRSPKNDGKAAPTEDA